MTAPLGASTSSSLFGARRRSSSRGTSALFLLHTYPATLRGSACQRVLKGAAGTAGPPPPRWAMSNQLRGLGALWTERDKRPCVRCWLLIYRPLHPLAERTPRFPVLGGVSSRSPAAARPLAAGSAAWACTGSRLTSNLQMAPLPAQGSDSPGSSVAPVPAPASPYPRAQGNRRLRSGAAQPPAGEPGMHPRQRRGRGRPNAPPTSGFTYFGPRPSWTSSILTAACPAKAQRPAHLWSRLT